jgi:hypothetical protein
MGKASFSLTVSYVPRLPPLPSPLPAAGQVADVCEWFLAPFPLFQTYSIDAFYRLTECPRFRLLSFSADLACLFNRYL